MSRSDDLGGIMNIQYMPLMGSTRSSGEATCVLLLMPLHFTAACIRSHRDLTLPSSEDLLETPQGLPDRGR